ncbi:glycosyl hydrolase 115 family protein [Polymorphobacter fuscus]|uniref:Gylcosyl hydrolase 115 C-terminal domain-containing protein n=1 Tax=Sandarakinorhabdus fusca TaxID=1439888 RepID=A0A7C9KXT5_9SPHN|nr:glycosyl hydrolase 115 family protein [Polymorphobacter fuscus]KAB7648562.1 hypothetical protein F9290_02375 [Polymorphobacter fuscus]MQT16108.1 hypothetical protein [Polymorphobacter fuscus]NJC07613.1 hypothetical protein [Polymorphobacter fuscus]
MISRRAMLGGSVAGGLLARPAVAAARPAAPFVIADGGGSVTPVCVAAQDWAGVRRAAADLAADIGRVTGTPAALLAPNGQGLPPRIILAGTLGRCPAIDALVAAGRVVADDIRGLWESYAIMAVADPMPGVAEALVIVGSDKRGTIYGLYDVAQAIGVSPWAWWADVPVPRRRQVEIASARHRQGPPAVKYRGIFLNDEAPCLTGWAAEKFGGLNAKFYTRVFELLLRLRANCLWPAMWNNAFAEDDPANPVLADEYGIVMGTSHHEPMTRAHKEWTRRQANLGNGAWNYATNRAAIAEFFTDGIKRNRDKEVVVTVGMRGDGDVALEGTGGMASDIRLLETVIADQRRIIADHKGVPADQVPQVWVLFTEVLKYYEAGLTLPDDVTLMFTDDNVGNLRRLPTPAERVRSGGAGIYFHMDMHGGPISYKWLNTSPLPKMWEQLNLALAYGADRIWIANVGDLKPLELPIDFFLSMAWDPAPMARDRIGEWTRGWAARQFGPDHATEIAALLARYAKANGWRKPEHLTPNTYSLDHFGEAERMAVMWQTLETAAEALNGRLPAEQRDAYYQLVLHPIRACANLTLMYIAAARNRRFAEQGRASTGAEAAEVERRFARDHAIRDAYNHDLAGGKWNHLMDQTHIGFFDWYSPVTDIMPAVTRIDLAGATGFGVAVEGLRESWPGYYLPPTLPVVDSLSRRPTYIDVFARGAAPLRAEVVADQPWVLLRTGPAFDIAGVDRRTWIDVDWAQLPPGRATATITVRGAGQAQTVPLVAIKASRAQESAARGRFGGLSGPFSIPAEAHAHATAVRGVHWAAIPDYGRVAVAMGIVPVDAPSFDDPAAAPSLTYRLYLAEAGDYDIDLVTSPTLQVDPARQLAIAVRLGDTAFETRSVFTPEQTETESFLGKRHHQAVLDTARTMRFTKRVDAPGAIDLTIAAIDPTFVLQNIIVSRGGLPASFFGPEPGRPQRDGGSRRGRR